MSQLSFAHVPSTGFTAFHTHFTTGAWSFVDISAYEGAGNQPLWDAPTLVVVKVRTKRAVTKLMRAIEGAGGAKGCDRIWDGCERQLNVLLNLAAASNDSAKRDAAVRLQKTLLLGAGAGQTRLRYQEEVDFGRKQLALISQGQGAADIALLGLGPVMAEIAQATEALAEAIGHGKSAEAPHRRKFMATHECVSTFEWAAEMLKWLIDDAGAGPNRDLAMALLASLDELAERYPRTTIAAVAEASPPSA